MPGYEHTCLIRGDGGRVLRAILDRICNKWTLLVVATLDQGTVRFTDLHQQIPGISQRMLTLTLRHLERDGLVSRTVHAEVPPRVEYALTPTGKSLIPPALALAGWAIEHVPHIEASRAAHESRDGRGPRHPGQ
ncbi:winged helix-turn-helix transcriptional regulator [Nonomuraea gerenzanensis]|uniref:Redox-sensing transcriptional regulator QorR, putative n=1 Tax=Nonomuraea gerenzanensis TaxID=93944 RepID=A0A1M4EBY9_9ACTN|nr:helix-turn-helix domain-containing protein [Nonomuraea gerenzanensis]UBU18471.1 helix-turn-helix transcriptional regulator [Nonomuraea gerenzanensis]SBO96310.1 Redox-sensing transcriptional regulator QorR, putative [Nonomuraea gerenzanensis]